MKAFIEWAVDSMAYFNWQIFSWCLKQPLLFRVIPAKVYLCGFEHLNILHTHMLCMFYFITDGYQNSRFCSFASIIRRDYETSLHLHQRSLIGQHRLRISPKPVHLVESGPHFIKGFSLQFKWWKCCFTLTLIPIQWSLKKLFMARQLCCHGMCKNLWSDGRLWNYSKAKFPSNSNCGQKIFSETCTTVGTVADQSLREGGHDSAEIRRPVIQSPVQSPILYDKVIYGCWI